MTSVVLFVLLIITIAGYGICFSYQRVFWCHLPIQKHSLARKNTIICTLSFSHDLCLEDTQMNRFSPTIQQPIICISLWDLSFLNNQSGQYYCL